ncbi:MAG: hypothetical protein KC457_05765, partial [Myxococcales bacterium]|nr:hypothetical protein [Myxococcales bacterium]
MVDAAGSKAPELRGTRAVVAIFLVVASLGGGAAWGWTSGGGPMGGLLGILIGAAVGALLFTILRAGAQA